MNIIGQYNLKFILPEKEISNESLDEKDFIHKLIEYND